MGGQRLILGLSLVNRESERPPGLIRGGHPFRSAKIRDPAQGVFARLPCGSMTNFFAAPLSKIRIALGRSIQRDHRGVDRFRDVDAIVQDRHHEATVVLHDRRLTGGQRVRAAGGRWQSMWRLELGGPGRVRRGMPKPRFRRSFSGREIASDGVVAMGWDLLVGVSPARSIDSCPSHAAPSRLLPLWPPWLRLVRAPAPRRRKAIVKRGPL